MTTLFILADTTGDTTNGNGEFPIELLGIAGILIVTMVMLRSARKKSLRSQERNERSVQERVDDLRNQQVTTDQMNELMASLAEMSRQINAQIDMRLTKLESLLSDADQKIAQLGGHSQSTPNNESNLNLSENAEHAIKRISDQFHHSDEQDTLKQKLQQGMQSKSSATTPPQTPNAPRELSDQAREVLQLLEMGLSKVAIAQRLSRPIGEIELILSLAGVKPESDH